MTRASKSSLPTISAKQLRLGLLRAGKRPETVDDSLHNMPGGIQRDEFLIEWQYGGEFRRDDVFIAFLAHRLGIPQSTLDAIFKA